MNCVEQTEIVASSFIMTTQAVTQHVKPLIFCPVIMSNWWLIVRIHLIYLSPNDFFLFPNIKNKMRGERFESPKAAWNISYTDFWGYSLRVEKMLRKTIKPFTEFYMFFYIVCRNFSSSLRNEVFFYMHVSQDTSESDLTF